MTRKWGWAVYRPDTGEGGAAGDSGTSGTGDGDGGQATGQTTPEGSRTPKQLQQDLEATRKEAAKHRAEKKKLEDRVAALEGEKLSEQDRIAKERDDERDKAAGLTQRVRSLEVKLAVAETAPTVGIVDAEAAVALLDTSGITFDDDGVPDRKQVDAALRDLVKRKPWLARQGTADGGGGAGGSNSEVSVNDWIRGRGASQAA